MIRVVLGRNQAIRLNGMIVEGTRDFDVQLDGQEVDITSWEHAWKSSLVVSASATIKLLIYWKQNYDTFANIFNRHPIQPVRMSVDGVVTGQFTVTNLAVKSPLNGVVAWEVTLRTMVYGT